MELELSAKEGGKLEKHICNERKRNANLVQRAKELFKKKNGKLFCEVCGFSFDAEVYGECAVSYIEAHHDVLHIKNMKEERTTRIDELRMVCPNCHKVLHIMEKSVDELAEIVKTTLKMRNKTN